MRLKLWRPFPSSSLLFTLFHSSIQNISHFPLSLPQIGDGTNFVVSFAGELMTCAEGLLRMGLHPSLINSGYKMAAAKAREFLVSPEFAAHTLSNIRDPVEVCLFLFIPLFFLVLFLCFFFINKVVNGSFIFFYL